MRAREAAQRALHAVLLDGRSSSTALPAALSEVDDARERGLASEIVYGVLRWQLRLASILGLLLERPLRERDGDVRLLLLAGAYQLLYTRVPAHAAVSETVTGCAKLGKPWARGLANAVLRRLAREKDTLLRRAQENEIARFAHPAWLIEALRTAWPRDWQAVLDAANEHPPMTLRVNTRLATRDDYQLRLADAGQQTTPCRHAPAGLTLQQALDATGLPGFADGAVSVQDAAAQLAAPLLDVRAGMRVLDACAAPGGKTAHLLELAPDAQVTALDVSASRLETVARNLERLAMHAHLLAADAACPAQWWDGRCFDRILLDAPCSATGVIRRHPDIKLHRTPLDIERLRVTQAALLDALWPLLARGGMLLYATCSILPGENARQVEAFLARTPDAIERPLEVSWGRPTSPGRQVLPHDERMDGFYYALLVRS